MTPARGARRPAVGLLLLASLPAAALAPARRAAAQGAAGGDDTPRQAPVVVVRDPGPGPAGRVLRSVLAAPHLVRAAGPADTVRIRRDSTFTTSVVVIGAPTIVDGVVRGDVVVVGGDLHVHPGATVDGRAIAYGGGVYLSSLATVRGGELAYRDQTFDVVSERRTSAEGADADAPAPDTLALDYRALAGGPPAAITFPVYGLHVPAYDRVDGLSLAVGPDVSLASGRVRIAPTVTYRSHLGAVDLGASAEWALGGWGAATLAVGRTTRTNEAWNWSDVTNSFVAFGAGIDARNYYRADVAEARVERRWAGATGTVTPFVGARTERAWSVGPGPDATSAPYSILRRYNRYKGMLRPNPPVTPGRITSALAGATADWTSQGVAAAAGATVEVPVSAVDDARFVQTTVDGTVGFPTFGAQRLDVFAHAVLTAGDVAPPQRLAYLGGEDGTILTRNLLELGGDQLAYVEGLYAIPVSTIRLGPLGSPVLALRYAAGTAGVGRLPAFDQNVGARLQLSVFRAYYAIDPATHRSRAGVTLSVFRR